MYGAGGGSIGGASLMRGLSMRPPARSTVLAFCCDSWSCSADCTNATSGQAQEVHAFIRERLVEAFDRPTAERMRIQYGGSVKPSNAREILSLENVDGALVGGASLVAEDFLGICNAYA